MASVLATDSRFILPRTSRRQQLLFTREELRQLLNEDLRRARKTTFALGVLADRDRAGGNRIAAERIDKRHTLAASHEAQIEQILLDIEGRPNAEVDELNMTLGASRVLERTWQAETIYSLHERARQLRTAGFSGLAKRMMRIVSEKQRDASR